MAAKKTGSRSAPRKRVRTAADKIQIREVVAVERGRKVSYFRVEGYLPNGERLRKRFPTIAEAEGELALQRVKVTNDATAIHTVNTFLTPAQVRDAEAATARLRGRHTLQEAVEWFSTYYARPDEEKTLEAALAPFLDAKERDGVRPRSVVPLKGTCKAFIEWVTLKLMPAELATDVAQARAACGEGNEWTPEYVVRELAIITPDFPRPAVHQITTEHVREFLSTRKARDGIKPASRKTFNNYRADLHCFFAWMAAKERRWTPANPVSPIERFYVARGLPSTLTLAEAKALMKEAASFKGGVMAPYFALALFTGIRTGTDGELHKLARHPDRAKLIDLKRGVIHIQPEISKTGDYRQVMIQPNLLAWLKAFPGPIFPKNHSHFIKDIRRSFRLQHDVLRHTFFSMHVAAFKSVGTAAIEGGNTESVLKRHYLNLSTYTEGAAFWKIMPPKPPRRVTRK